LIPLCLAISVQGAPPGAPPPEATRGIAPAQRDLDVENSVNWVPDAQRLRLWHDMLGSEPHIAGSDGDRRVIDSIARSFREMGLEVEVHEIWPLLCQPVDARLEIVTEESLPPAIDSDGSEGASGPSAPTRRGVVGLPVRESNLVEDPYSAHPGLTYGWNAFSGSGDVTAEIVYANYGTKDDFRKLEELGVDCSGKIVIARYGGNYRGFKVKYAEEAGAAGLIMYTDPDDAGYRKGLVYPEGGWANETCIQRGSIDTTPYPGDPLTPGREASKDAERLGVDEVDLPTIPVQPIGWSSAQQIMARMKGPGVPTGWQGGLPFPYRLEGGPQLRVRLMVKQERKLTQTANVIGTLRGVKFPGEWVIVGCHHDAWGFGAADPLAGTIVLMEAARSFAELARQGQRPDRTIVFAAWAAEEFGIIGSTEWCEANRDELATNAIAYINLDMASMGCEFGSSAAPSLKQVILDAARRVPQARDPESCVHDAWLARMRAAKPGGEAPSMVEPTLGTLGGGSDHIGFYSHLGIPSCSLGAGGSPGTAYHSNFDTLAWYRKVVGEDYEPALMVTRVTNLVVARLADAPLLPLQFERYAQDMRQYIDALANRAIALDVKLDLGGLRKGIEDFDRAAIDASRSLNAAIESGLLTGEPLAAINRRLIDMERAWIDDSGLPQHAWHRNLYATSDPFSGYASWPLPLLRWHVEAGDADQIARAVSRYEDVMRELAEHAAAIGTLAAHDAGREQPAP
jgi:N-acetylated-alpha-linked acidic dipeptidase